MSKIFDLVRDLKLCYETKVPTAEEYVKLTEYEKRYLCNDIKTELVNYVNSKEYCFYDIMVNKIDKIQSNLFHLIST
jgi:hypothetical protein